MSRLLVIDDEEGVRGLLLRALQSAGYTVDQAGSATAGLTAAVGGDYDLVVLDLMLPDRPGSEVLAEILARRPGAKILVLSAVPEIGTRVQVLDAGALDFLPKPFVIAELLARVRARLRTPGSAAPGNSRFLQVGDLRLDTQRRTVSIGGQQTMLSHREFLLLNHLMQRADEVCSRDELLADVWGYQFDPGSNVVDVYVRRLRSKLDGLRRIETVRNVGYCLSAS
ncbi:response regulator transcription factor [Amycolatopsis sp. CA-126428]|uniref:response regulator transcription factor n=1 Tax=Amycolatopsis sp. CA-126428 TaxID=2073158 RepID=UPI000CD0139D|nr:response regulator transcription factor [Amycolatopsis sp. CA-126428]